MMCGISKGYVKANLFHTCRLEEFCLEGTKDWMISQHPLQVLRAISMKQGQRGLGRYQLQSVHNNKSWFRHVKSQWSNRTYFLKYILIKWNPEVAVGIKHTRFGDHLYVSNPSNFPYQQKEQTQKTDPQLHETDNETCYRKPALAQGN